MADEQTVGYLQRRVSELEGVKAQLETALKQARGERKAATEAKAGLEQQVQALTAERDGAKAQLEKAPGEWQAKAVELQARLAEREFRDVFRDKALAAGVKPEAVGDLLQLSGLKPPDGELPANHFDEFLAGAKQARGWAFADSPPAGQPGASQASAGQPGASHDHLVTPPVAPPPGAGRGGSDHSSALFTVRRSDAANSAWMQANQSRVAEATANGSIRWAD
jgi:hypothetical protein